MAALRAARPRRAMGAANARGRRGRAQEGRRGLASTGAQRAACGAASHRKDLCFVIGAVRESRAKLHEYACPSTACRSPRAGQAARLSEHSLMHVCSRARVVSCTRGSRIGVVKAKCHTQCDRARASVVCVCVLVTRSGPVDHVIGTVFVRLRVRVRRYTRIGGAGFTARAFRQLCRANLCLHSIEPQDLAPQRAAPPPFGGRVLPLRRSPGRCLHVPPGPRGRPGPPPEEEGPALGDLGLRAAHGRHREWRARHLTGTVAGVACHMGAVMIAIVRAVWAWVV